MTINDIFHVLRFHPHQDLKGEIRRFVTENDIEAASIVMGIGSLETANIRLAQDHEGTVFPKQFEILTLMGTASKSGGLHLHISLADGTGATLGGHLMDGCLIFTTAELTLIEHKNKRFLREPDSQTGYLELKILP